MKLCECGCGSEVPFAKRRRIDDQPRFISGHHARVMNLGKRYTSYVPTPDEIPSGICECGCGKKTNIVRNTRRKLRHFRGYPYPRLSGHTSQPLREASAQWKGGVRISDKGYRLIYQPEHPNANSKGYVLEHRLVMSKMLKRPLQSNEHVHHKNGNKLDNRRKNLELTTASEHRRHHNLEEGRLPPWIPR